ncbi:MAG: hypothetical protein ACLUQY_07535 [Weissella confusa]
MAEHLGAEWNQIIIRHQGFPHFHWLQAQSGWGFWVRDKRYELSPGMGI